MSHSQSRSQPNSQKRTVFGSQDSLEEIPSLDAFCKRASQPLSVDKPRKIRNEASGSHSQTQKRGCSRSRPTRDFDFVAVNEADTDTEEIEFEPGNKICCPSLH